MFSLFKDIKSFAKWPTIKTDNVTFRLFHSFSVFLHGFMLILLGSKQYFGDPITCDSQSNDIPKDIMETYCWIQGTWTVEEYLGPTTNLSAVVHQGVGVEMWGRTYHRIYHYYYQWIPTVLLIYTAIFFVPRLLWKYIEGGFMSDICKHLTQFEPDQEKETTRVKSLLLNWRGYNRSNNRYLRSYLTCLFMNFVFLILVAFSLNLILQGRFAGYGPAFVNHYFLTNQEKEQTINPLEEIFPKMTKCQYRRFGMSGTIEYHHALCIIPLNILNEKVFLVLWVYYVFLALWIVSQMISYGFTSLIRFARVEMNARYFHLPRCDVSLIDDFITIGDWFMLHQLKKNVHSVTFNNFKNLLVSEMRLRINRPNENDLIQLESILDDDIATLVPLDEYITTNEIKAKLAKFNQKFKRKLYSVADAL